MFRLQAQSSPRRVAVPVLVKDGKPCSGTSDTPINRGGGGQQTGGHCAAHSPSLTHQPPQQHQQSACTSTATLLSNMAYQRQNLQHQHQQSANMCSSYLPLQGRAW